ncbi:hypothetical protein [Streptococcus himalayensis]|uniref:Uncharacterized protein n=1 Tax=Streptococcus himalayensis TaxID=1888195 RepID=A0A917EDV6_9STRE|nr:hypothetical protein [Streptococcus himalayensis]GGE26472.1 hypothetical protein GCM10011510_04580 [Streptococcus himalayensis]
MNKRTRKKYSHLNVLGLTGFQLKHGTIHEIKKGNSWYRKSSKPTRKYYLDGRKFKTKKKARCHTLVRLEDRLIMHNYQKFLSQGGFGKC